MRSRAGNSGCTDRSETTGTPPGFDSAADNGNRGGWTSAPLAGSLRRRALPLESMSTERGPCNARSVERLARCSYTMCSLYPWMRSDRFSQPPAKLPG